MTHFLPVTMQELLETGVSQPDFVYITGDAYVDHPSFGAAIITRLLESQATASLSSPSRLAHRPGLSAFRQAETGVSGDRRQHRLHGRPLHLCQAKAQQ